MPIDKAERNNVQGFNALHGHLPFTDAEAILPPIACGLSPHALNVTQGLSRATASIKPACSWAASTGPMGL